MRAASYEQGDANLIYGGLRTNGVLASFSLRSFYERSAFSNRERLIRHFVNAIGLPGCSFARAEQVHGSNVVCIEESGFWEGADGLATDRKNLVLTVVVADCLPIFLWGGEVECVALLHAGWRGTAAGIVGNGIRALMERLEASPDKMSALLGPCICSACYEVGPEVAAKFDSMVLMTDQEGQSHLDLRKANCQQLIESGIYPDNIISDERCTRCQQEIFFSYRGEGQETGRMIAALSLIGDPMPLRHGG